MTRTPEDRLIVKLRDLRRRIEVLERHSHPEQSVPPCDCVEAVDPPLD